MTDTAAPERTADTDFHAKSERLPNGEWRVSLVGRVGTIALLDPWMAQLLAHELRYAANECDLITGVHRRHLSPAKAENP
jgi:hypothetical protein